MDVSSITGDACRMRSFRCYDALRDNGFARHRCLSCLEVTVDMDDFWLCARWLLLLGLANGAPIVATRLFGERWSAPLDGGLRFVDGQPLLGSSKTVRGVLVAMTVTALAAAALGESLAIGAAVGALSMLGDMLSSFTKRRLGIVPSGKATGIDQIPEALLPLVVFGDRFGLSWWQIAAITLAFLLLEVPVSRVLFRFGVRNRPY